MKKAIYLVAVATLAFFSCQKQELDPSAKDDARKGFTFKASIEQLTSPTKADINADNDLVWAAGDKIGVCVPDWGEKNQPFTLIGAGGVTSGDFEYDYDEHVFNGNATAAFFPWGGTGSSVNNYYGGTIYFKLKNEYWNYDNSNMLTPLVASLSDNTNDINFKHAGAAIKLTINNLTSGTYKVKMSVDGQQITGDYHINPANAGTEALALDENAADATKNNITLNSWKSNGAFSWIFPVPELTKPKLQFEVKDENGIVVWSKKLKAQSQDLSRGDILVMPALPITPYEKFVQDNTTSWHFHGTINGSSWMDVPMVTDGKYWIFSGFTFKSGDEFKINKGDEWYPDSNWTFTDSNKGSKDIIFNSETKEISVVSHKYPYPSVELSQSISITDNSFADWELIPSETNGNTSVKVASDDTNIYVYVQRDNNSAIWGGAGYVYVILDLDNDFSGTVGAGDIFGNKGDFVALLYPFAGTSSEPAFNTTPTSDWQVSPSTYSIGNIKLRGEATSSAVTIELSIPRTDIPAIPSSGPIAIKVSGNKSMSGASISRTL